MRHIATLASLMLVARLGGAQVPEGVQVIGSDNARVTVYVTKDSAFLSLMMPDGSGFVVRTDSITMATWADNADLLTSANASARVQGVTFTRLSADSNPQYRVSGDDGDRHARMVLATDSARVLFGAMRGEQQRTMAAKHAFLLQTFFQHVTPILPRVLHEPKIQYPESLRAMHFDGDVVLACDVDSSGRVVKQSIRVVRSTDPAFTDAAKDALLHTYFAPAELNGHHIGMPVQKPYHFSISDQ